jgi:hypothetical protein
MDWSKSKHGREELELDESTGTRYLRKKKLENTSDVLASGH